MSKNTTPEKQTALARRPNVFEPGHSRAEVPDITLLAGMTSARGFVAPTAASGSSVMANTLMRGLDIIEYPSRDTPDQDLGRLAPPILNYELTRIESLPVAEVSAYDLNEAERPTADGQDDAILKAMPTIAEVGRYALKYQLGQGGLGTVYAAYDPLLSRSLAVKTLRLGVPAEQRAGLEDMLLTEARAAASFNHPNIVTVYDAGLNAHGVYLAMERLNGRDLREMLADGWRADPWDVAHIVKRVASALDYAHDQGVIHCDIKPANIFMVAPTQPKVVDFGIARVARQAGVEFDAERTQRQAVVDIATRPADLDETAAANDQGPEFAATQRQATVQGDTLAFAQTRREPMLGDDEATATATVKAAPSEPTPADAPQALYREALSPYYAAPEQIEGGVIDARTDLYALGVVMHELLTGQKPFTADSIDALKTRVLQGQAPAPVAIDAKIPRELSNIVVRAMARNPEQRFASADEMVQAIEACVQKQETAQAMRGPKRLAVAGTILGATLLGALLFSQEVRRIEAAAREAILGSRIVQAAPRPVPAPPVVTPRPTPKATSEGVASGSKQASKPTPKAAPVVAAAPKTAMVQIAVAPWGQIEVNGKPMGMTPPLTQLTLPTGIHSVVVRNGDFAPHKATIVVDGQRPVVVRHRFGP